MDVAWLSADAGAVESAMATERRTSRPRWLPSRRQLLVHVNTCLLIWYLAIVLLTVGVRVDTAQDGTVRVADVWTLAGAAIVLAIWLAGTVLLRRWAARPPSARARLAEWRRTLTALANGFEPRPSQGAAFAALITTGGRPLSSGGHGRGPGSRVRSYPRFTAPGVEFGVLTGGAGRAGDRWTYLAVTLPAPLPHLVLDATANDRLLESDLPTGVDRSQLIRLEGGFDAHFRVYSPVEYRTGALYVLTPDLMAALIDHASAFDVEILDDRLVLFRPGSTDFDEPAAWQAVGALLSEIVPRVVRKAERYYDERVPGQETPRLLARLEAEREHPELPWVEPVPRIGPDGRRLVLRDGWSATKALAGTIGWFALLVLLYPVPGIFAFAGFMSIIDGR
jgi:hypothetical protein